MERPVVKIKAKGQKFMTLTGATVVTG